MNIFVSLLFLSACLVPQISAGTCPKYPLIRDFNFMKYLGLWHQQDKKKSGFEAPGRCWKSMYLRDPKNGQFKLQMIFENTITGREEKYDSQISLKGPQNPSVIKYSIPLTFFEDEFQVLATDYESFSIEYMCNSNGILEKKESVYLLTRAKNPSPIILQKAYAIMHQYGIDIRKLERVDQTCGGVTFEGDALLNGDPESYYQSPEQALPEIRRYQKDPSSQYDYYDAPHLDSKHLPFPSPAIRRRQPQPPPAKRRFVDARLPTNRFQFDQRVRFGQSLASQLQKYLVSRDLIKT